MTSYILLVAVLTIFADGQDIVYYKCSDFPINATSKFEFSCDGRKIIIVKSAVIGVTDKFNPPNECPITNNTCLRETTIPTELCTGRNSCVINQNFVLYDESKIPCSYMGTTPGNFININYTCIVPGFNNYGDICHFDEVLFSNITVYISSYPNFPDTMGRDANYQCSCRFAPISSSSASISIRALLVQLNGASICSERLSIVGSKNDTGLTFCSPCTNANNVTTVSFASDTAIMFRRDPGVSPFNGKFILEITVSSNTSGSGSMGSMRCGYVDSIMSSSTSISTISPSYISTTRAIVSQNIGFSGTNVQNTSLESRSSNVSSNTQLNTMSSLSTASDTQNDALLSSTAGKNLISTGGIIGIVLGSVGLIVIVIIVLLCLIRKRKQRHGHSRPKGNTNFKLPKSLSVIQNLHRTSTIELHDATSSESHTFQSAEHFSSEPQTGGYENNGQRKDDFVSNYEEGAPVPHITNGPGMFPANQRSRMNDKMADDHANEKLSRNSGSDDVTLVENQLYGENEITVTDGASSSLYDVVRPDTSSSHYDVARPVTTSSDYEVAKPVVAASDYDVAKPVNTSGDYDVAKPVVASSGYDVVRPVATSSDYDVVRPVVQDARTNESADVDRGYAQMKNSSADHSYYNVPVGTRVQPSAEVSGIETTDPMHNADSDVVLIDNTLYGSTFLVSNH